MPLNIPVVIAVTITLGGAPHPSDRDIAHENRIYVRVVSGTPEMGMPCCYVNVNGDTVIPFGRYRYCNSPLIQNFGIVLNGKRFVAIDNKGKELFGIFAYDNGPDPEKDGLFRITDEQGRFGFADTTGKIAIVPQYRFAYPFENGKAKVTLKGNRRKVPGSNGEHYYWENGDWFFIDKKGKTVSPVKHTRNRQRRP